MKLLLENWREYLNEDWRDTSWESDDEKVTIRDVVNYLGDETVDINVLELSQQLPELPTRAAERVAAASLDYPIIVVKSRGQYRSVLDGNHRLQKAIDEEVETIKTKILDLDNPETPEVFQKMFGEADISQTEEYIKHTALNLGMVARNLVGPHDKNLKERLKEIFNDLYYAAIPPRTHHTKEDLQSMSDRSAWKWFLCGWMDDEQYKEECS